MNIQKGNSISFIVSLLLISLISACGSEATPTPLLNLPTLAPPSRPSSIPAVDPSPSATASVIAETAIEQLLELTPSMTLETATGQASPTAIAIAVSTDVPSNCIAPSEAAGWRTYRKYTIQVNDTLFSLAKRTNTTLEKIQRANCRNMNDILIYAGQTLYLPLLPTPITAIAAITTPTAPPTGFSPRIVVTPTTGTSETIFTFLIRDYQPYMEIMVRIESAAGSEIVRFRVKMDAKGNRDVLWQSPKILSPGFYAVKPYNPGGTLGEVGTIVIVPPAYP